MVKKQDKTKKTKPEEKALPAVKETAPAAAQTVEVNRVWLILALCGAFLLGMGIQFVADNGFPKISITWGSGDDCPDGEQVDSSLAGWVKKNRPALPGDYPAAGRALFDTAERLSSGVLAGGIDACADTIARIQPEVSDPGVWREFCDNLSKKIGDVPAVELAGKYREAAQAFGPRAAAGDMPPVSDGSRSARCALESVEALAEVAIGGDNEEGDCEVSVPAGDNDCALGDERQDEGENIAGDGREDRGTVPEDETASWGTGRIEPAAGAERGQCPGGQCPTRPVQTYSGSYSPYNWFGGWGWF